MRIMLKTCKLCCDRLFCKNKSGIGRFFCHRGYIRNKPKTLTIVKSVKKFYNWFGEKMEKYYNDVLRERQRVLLEVEDEKENRKKT